MFCRKKKEKARALLNKYAQYLPLEPDEVEGLPSFKTRLVEQELHERIKELRIILQKKNPLPAFINNCKLRAKELMQYSSLGFAEMNQSNCNRLYWEMTTLLLDTTTMSQQLAVLMPHIREVITPFVTRFDPTKPWYRRNLCVTLEKKSIESLTGPPDLTTLAGCIMEDGSLFDIHQIANFDFALHQQFYTALNQYGYNLLAKKLYEYNHALRTLHNRILMLSGKGALPLRVIWSLIVELRLGGETRTGSEVASIGAQQAFTDFNAYLASLPSQFREQLFALKCWNDDITFENVMRDLHNANCIETAAAFRGSLEF